MSTRKRLDAELVRRGLASSRGAAKELVAEKRVVVSGVIAASVARGVLPGEPIELRGDPPQFVGRGGKKLDAALDRFGIDVQGMRAIDIGSSTGGFTDCLLQRGAASVLALDVGHGQLHEKLRGDHRVRVVERTNVRDATLESLAERAFDLCVVDVSFISLRTVFSALRGFVKPNGELVLLVKPQFEAGRKVVSRGRGVVNDPLVWHGTLMDVLSNAASQKATTIALMRSPILGAEGNVEFLAHLRATSDGDVDDDEQLAHLAEMVRAVVADFANAPEQRNAEPGEKGHES